MEDGFFSIIFFNKSEYCHYFEYICSVFLTLVRDRFHCHRFRITSHSQFHPYGVPDRQRIRMVHNP